MTRGGIRTGPFTFNLMGQAAARGPTCKRAREHDTGMARLHEKRGK